MTATNHGLAGALIGAALPLPLAMPLAFVSHFVMDAIPHFGIKGKERERSRLFKMVVKVDTIIGLSVNIPLIYAHRWDMFICAWLAYSPDIPIVVHYLKYKSTDGNHHWPFKWRLFTLPHNEHRLGIIQETILAVILYTWVLAICL